MSTGFKWVQTPEKLGEKIEQYGDKVEAALYAIAGYWGQDVQDQMRQEARWTDRTGNARGGLFYAVEGFGMGEMIGQVESGAKALMKDTTVERGGRDVLVIAVSHTVFYGKYLELDHSGRYAIILATMEANLPKLERMMADYVRRI